LVVGRSATLEALRLALELAAAAVDIVYPFDINYIFVQNYCQQLSKIIIRNVR
jgi:hypothetical protein